MSINLNKKISLVKEVLEQKNISDIQGQIVLALDISGSMSPMFINNTVQELVERLLAVGINMDLDKQIDVFLFGSNAHEAKPATLKNIEKYVDKEILNKYELEGGTRYAPVIKRIAENASPSVAAAATAEKPKGFLSKLFGGKQAQSATIPVDTKVKEPTIVFFVTDGENFDKSETTELIRNLSSSPIFFQFVGLGNENFVYLKNLDTMGGRVIDNANFFDAGDIRSITDEELYERILGELPDWLKEVKQKGILK